MRRYFYSLVIALSFFWISCSSLPEKEKNRHPGSVDVQGQPGTDVRFAWLDLPTKEESGVNRLVLIGTAQKSLPFKVKGYEIEALGFHPSEGPMEDMEPKFLFTMNKFGVDTIYSFTVPVKSPKSGLPPILVDIGDIVKRQIRGSAPSTGSRLVKVFKNVVTRKLLKSWRAWGGEKERARADQALILQQTIRNVLLRDDKEIIGDVFERESLRELEDILRVRFDPNGEYWTYNTTRDQRIEHGEVLMNKEENFLLFNADQLFQLVNSKKGWDLTYLDDEKKFALLSWNCTYPLDGSVKKYIPKHENYEAFQTLLDLHCGENVSSVPIQQLYLGDSKGPVTLIDFADPTREWAEKPGVFKRLLRLPFKIAALPFKGAAAIAAEKNSSINGSRPKKLISSSSRQHRAYVELLGKLKTGMGKPIGNIKADVDPIRFNVSLILGQLSRYQTKDGEPLFSVSQLENFENKLAIADENTQNDIFLEIAQTFGNAALGAGALSVGPELLENRWGRFVVWLQEGTQNDVPARRHLEELGDHLDKKALSRQKKENKLKKKQNRKIDSVAERRPVIILLVDSLRPDRLYYAAKKGLIPNIQKIFIEGGVELESYNTLSNSIASWGTVLSGNDPDQTTIRGNVANTRGFYSIDDGKVGTKVPFVVTESDLAYDGNTAKLQKYKASGIKIQQSEILSYIDPRNDREFLGLLNKAHMAVRRVRSLDKLYYTDYLPKSEVAVTVSPVHSGQEFPGYEILTGLLSTLIKKDDGTLNSAAAYDRANLDHLLKVIRKDSQKGEKRLFSIYLAGLDHEGHNGVHLYEHAFKELDEKVGELYRAAQKHVTLRNGVWLLLSDHGMSGGFEYPKSETSPMHFLPRPILRETNKRFLLANTQFNLHDFFVGDFNDNVNYRFVVGSHSPSGPDQKGGLFSGKSFTWRGLRGNKGRAPYKDNRTILVAQSGNAVSPILLLDDPLHPTRRASFYKLSHYTNPEMPVAVNIPDDLLNLSLSAHKSILDTTHGQNGIVSELKKYNGLRPIGIFAMGLQGEAARLSAEVLTESEGQTNDEPILVRASGERTALILTRWERDVPKYRYVVIKKFGQSEAGEVYGEVSEDPDDDPLEYLGLNGKTYDSDERYRWLTDKQWVSVMHREWNPTAVGSLPKIFHVAPEIRSSNRLAEFQSEIPDFLVTSSYGFDFNTNQAHIGDHGGYTADQTRTSLFINDGEGGGYLAYGRPVFTRDILPTVLDYLGVEKPVAGGRGVSIRSYVKGCRDGNLKCKRVLELLKP